MPESAAEMDAAAEENPLLKEWTGPCGGVPPFDRVELRYFQPALEQAMAEKLGEIDAIASSSDPPTFENTIAALEQAGETLDRVRSVYSTWSGNLCTPDFQAIEREMAPKLAAFSDQIIQNEKLFRRIEAVYEARDKAELTAEQRRLAWLYHNNFVRAGARLDAASKARLSEINQELAKLFTEFSQNVLADETEQFLTLESADDLAGLPESARASAAAAAEAKGLAGKWVIANTRSAIIPFLTYADRRDLRERAWRLFTSRGEGGQHDNSKIIARILKLRAERASLLGYKTHAHWRTENTMAGTPERAMQLMEEVWPAAVARVKEEVAELQAVADAEEAGIKIAPWDYYYYGEKVRQERFDVDDEQVQQYLQIDRLVDAMFWVAGQLFHLDFKPADDVPTFHPDMRVWRVSDRASGRELGLFYLDPYAREGKRSGAWMSAYRSQQAMEKSIVPLVSNNCNFVEGPASEPKLISWNDAKTLFHEFGHALHGLCSSVTYPSLAGTSVVRDYVEFPSQLLEHWLDTPEVLERFARHHQTGEPIPEALVARIERASLFMEGFRTTEYLAGALYDMKIHLVPGGQVDPAAFEKQLIEEIGMPPEIVLRHRPTHFLHVFASDGYSAGYYSYLWSDVLTADAYEAFVEADGPYDSAVARRLKAAVLSVGNTLDPAESFRAFRGRDPITEPLMRKRGFLPAKEGT